MSAKVAKKFDNRFELNEEGLRRIHSDLRKRIPEEHQKEIIFEVHREDALVYRTSEIDRVLSESNDSTQKINSLTIEYKAKALNINLLFEAVRGAELTVVGEDRDEVFLISSELKEYIQKEVATISSFSFFSYGTVLTIFALCMAGTLMYLTNKLSGETTPEALKVILDSGDSNLKLNYLITSSRDASPESIPKFLIMLPAIFVFITAVPHRAILNYVLPGNIFLIGKQISIISNRRANAKNIFWGGIVALTIALATGYYFFWLAK